MELPFAALHQLCWPLIGDIGVLPPPQREALQVAFGMAEGDVPDRFLVSLAALSLLSAAAEQQPLLCVVDDAQWLDRSSAQVLGFVARRLLADPVALVFGVRWTPEELAGLPELRLEGLPDSEARALLREVLPGPMDGPVLGRIVAETRGNPLALLELPRGLTASELAGGFGLPTRCRPGSRPASCAGWSGCPPIRSGCCSSQPPSPPAIRRCCGGPPARWA